MKYLVLKGGLGNQLFQLAYFFYLKEKKNNENLKLDLRSGFILDFKYKRKLEISSLVNSKYACTKYTSFINLILIIINKYIPIIFKKTPILFIKDKDYLKISNEKINSFRYIIYDGYFQNSDFVNKSIDKIKSIFNKELNINFSSNFIELYKEIRSTKNSVALCIRFYEETKDPKKHSNNLKSYKNVEDFNRKIVEIEKKVESPTFYIFVQNQNDFTKKLVFNSPYKFITHDFGYLGSWQRLLAQSYCNHHLFNNSTFYYWGSKFSNYQNMTLDPIIYATDNFLFQEIYESSWILF